WGLWHAPLTCVGHNFGVDYPFFPFLGILMMCIMCASMSSFLTLLTKRTGSVFPAALAHGANNQLTGVIISFLATEEFLKRFSAENNIIVIDILPIAIVGVISYIILIMDYMKKKKEA
ncbi:MAG: CPBP family intramembrane metalloprotease, partial [Oscillospiraceae bacterium]|nr:CPBP family intramembrane metalloprotease [Oscillospiraceae bacterium]